VGSTWVEPRLDFAKFSVNASLGSTQVNVSCVHALSGPYRKAPKHEVISECALGCSFEEFALMLQAKIMSEGEIARHY